MPVSFQPPKLWQDWLSWALGFWLVLSPWTLNYADDIPALRNAAIVGFLLILIEVITLTAFRPWEEWADVVIGVWLITAPFMFDFVNPAGIANSVIVGTIVLLLALYELWQINARGRSRT